MEKKQTLKTHYFWFCPSPYTSSYVMLRKLNSKTHLIYKMEIIMVLYGCSKK